MARKLCLTALFCAVCVWAAAQNTFITANEKPEMAKSVDLKGKASVVFLSPHDDLVIETSNQSLDSFQPKKQNTSKLYEYEVIADLSRNDRVYKIARRGTALTTDIKKMLRSNQRIYIYVAEVENPIMYNEQGGHGGGHFVEGEACVEFTTTIKGLQITTSPKLACQQKKSKSSTGADVVSVIVDMVKFDKMRTQVQALRDESEALSARLTQTANDGGNVTAEEWDRSDELEKQAAQAEIDFNEASVLTMHGDKTNTLAISIADIGMKEKRTYAVLAMRDSVKVHDSAYDEKLDQALEAERNLQFATARDFYKLAAGIKGISATEKSAATAKMAEMDECIKYTSQGNAAIDLIKQKKKKGGQIKYSELTELYNVGIQNFRALYQIRPLERVQKMIDNLQSGLAKLPVVVEGTTFYSEIKQGREVKETAADVDIYGIEGGYTSAMEKGAHGTRLGRVATDGTFHLELEPGKYNGLLFVPGNTKRKNKYERLSGKEHLNMQIKIGK